MNDLILALLPFQVLILVDLVLIVSIVIWFNSCRATVVFAVVTTPTFTYGKLFLLCSSFSWHMTELVNLCIIAAFDVFSISSFVQPLALSRSRREA